MTSRQSPQGSRTPPSISLPSRIIRSPLQNPAATSATPVRATNLNAAELQGRQINDLYVRTEGLDAKTEALFARMEARMEANLQNAIQKLAFDVADGTKLQRESSRS